MAGAAPVHVSQAESLPDTDGQRRREAPKNNTVQRARAGCRRKVSAGITGAWKASQPCFAIRIAMFSDAARQQQQPCNEGVLARS